jgi:Fe2+ transport system protein FeoA
MNFILKSDKYHPAMIQVQLTPRSVGQQIPGDRYRGITHNSHCVPCYPWMYPLRLRNFRLQAGITCRIRSLGSNPRIADRLAQMGILPGIEVTVLRIGPMGNPLELAVGGSQAIALRASETDTLDCELVSLPLSLARSDGQTYRIRALQGGQRYQEKLAAAGLRPGVLLQVVSNRPWRLQLLPNNACVQLGQGEAEKMIIEPVDSTDA